MRVHEHPEAVALCHPQHLNCMRNELLIVFAWPLMFNSLPGEDIANRVISPSLQLCKMLIGLLFIEWASNKGYIVRVEEVFGFVGWNIRMSGEFAVASDVDATERHFSIEGIAKCCAINLEGCASHLDRGDFRVRHPQGCRRAAYITPWLNVSHGNIIETFCGDNIFI